MSGGEEEEECGGGGEAGGGGGGGAGPQLPRHTPRRLSHSAKKVFAVRISTSTPSTDRQPLLSLHAHQQPTTNNNNLSPSIETLRSLNSILEPVNTIVPGFKWLSLPVPEAEAGLEAVLPPEADLAVARAVGSAVVEDVEVDLSFFPFPPLTAHWL